MIGKNSKNILLVYIECFFVKVSKIVDPDKILELRRSQSKVYLEYGNITESAIGPDGALSASVDKYVRQSTYFAAERRGRIVGGVRIIGTLGGELGAESLQIHEELNESILQEYSLLKCAEISGLFKTSDTHPIIVLFLLRKVYSHAKKNSIQVLFTTISKGPYEKYSNMFGEKIELIHEPFKIKRGENIVYPCIVRVNGFWNDLQLSLKKRSLTKRILLFWVFV